MPSNRHTTPRLPLDKGALDRLALHYVGRYATSRAKLKAYLRRKVQERGWSDADPVDIDAVVVRCAALGYVDDRLFAESRATSFVRRGYGGRRISMALQAAGIEQDVVADVMPDEDAAYRAAESFARRRRIGAFGEVACDPKVRQRQIAAMLRAGHSFDLVKRFIDAVADDPTSADI
jgi:regulatory protein